MSLGAHYLITLSANFLIDKMRTVVIRHRHSAWHIVNSTLVIAVKNHNGSHVTEALEETEIAKSIQSLFIISEPRPCYMILDKSLNLPESQIFHV